MAEPGVPRHYVIQCPGLPLGGNARRRALWPVVYRNDKTFREAVAWQARTLCAGAAPLERAHVVATLVYTQRRFLDPDNAAASLKGCVSGLILGGMIVDDSAERLRLDVRQEVGLSRRVQIDVTEVAPEVGNAWPCSSTQKREG